MLETLNIFSKAPKWLSDCTTCQAIWRRLTDDKYTDEINLGSFEEALSTQCSTHKPLIQSFFEYVCAEGDYPTSKDVGFDEGYEGDSLQIRDTLSGRRFESWGLLLVKKSVPDHPGTGRKLDPDWVDLDILNKWKHTCLSSHGTKCENPLRIWHTRPAWLIDVGGKCLVPGTVAESYVALSYTYGRHTQIPIDAGTLAKLQEPQALESPQLSEYVAPIIRNAIYLTSAIGERYLWADALCITHHDRRITTEQLSLMGAIYANAVVTIIAADGDSESGLAGLKGISKSRQMNQKILPFRDEQLIVRNTELFDLYRGLPYYERGWIYQEYKMSQRRILFNRGELHWECQCSVWHEEMIPGAEIDKYVDTRLKLLLAGFCDDNALKSLIEEYNELTLRYDEDALPAISGLLSVISRSFEGGFLYGIPEMFFERGLCWKPSTSMFNLRRRVRSSRPEDTQLTPDGLPSWSWVGWQGEVSAGFNEATRVTVMDYIEETIPITEWYTSHSPTDPPSKWRRIRSTWYEKRDCYKDFAKPLPPGWTRHDTPAVSPWHGEPRLYPDGCDKYVFTHDAMPETSEGLPPEWYYPFPVIDIQETTPPVMPEQTQYLFCETTKARLSGYHGGDGNEVVFRSSLKEQIGTLYLVNNEFLPLFPKSLDDKGFEVDLVAVCKTRTYSKTFNEETGTFGLPLTNGNTYNVLWIEWKDGIAYRLASGQVDAGEWEKLDQERISLILG
ncbi:hypothetical protein NW762_013622 [Fusarium torreyae]|uniref:Heterokaryon incompatibility domain-containing protein n=1 Tax=Fusarium torreyae TaxID=1237075 RepID=A0A9W8RLK2_9HYPO|nr:hypothetical protein NW762_013622 [Fusarium torreyae]